MLELKSARVVLAGLLVLAGMASPAMAELTAETAQTLTGSVLVERLREPGDCMAAFYELLRRDVGDTCPHCGKRHNEVLEYPDFLEQYFDPVIVLCPQGHGLPPVTVIEYGRNYQLTSQIPRRAEEYPEAGVNVFVGTVPDTGKPYPSWEEPSLLVVAADGRIIMRSALSLSDGETLADLNADGITELVSHDGGYSTVIDSTPIDNLDLFSVCTVQDTPVTLLRVLYNWNTHDWLAGTTDTDQDGISEYVFGRTGGDGVFPRLLISWDSRAGAYRLPDRRRGEHYVVLEQQTDSAVNNWDDYQRFVAEKLRFQLDIMDTAVFTELLNTITDAGTETFTFSFSPEDNRYGTPPPPGPYRYASLRGLVDTELVSYMGAGLTKYDYEALSKIATHIPDEFWTLPADVAALRMAEENRLPAHREQYQLALDRRGVSGAPAELSVMLANFGGHDQGMGMIQYYVNCVPGQSYIAYAMAGDYYHGYAGSQTFHDLRYVPLDDALARQVVQTIWWLDRVRSREIDRPGNLGNFFSVCFTGENQLALTLRDARDSVLLDCEVTKWWGGEVSDRWTGQYDREVCANLAAYVVERALTQRLGDSWPELATPWTGRDTGWREQYSASERALLRQLLPRVTGAQGELLPLAREIIIAAGELTDTAAAPLLRALLTKLPPEGRLPTVAELESRLEKVGEAQSVDVARNWVEDQAERERVQSALQDARCGVGDYARERLRASVLLALRQIDAASQPEQLRRWACSTEDGWRWALHRLMHRHPDQYKAALQWWEQNMHEPWARQALLQIAYADSPAMYRLAPEETVDEEALITMGDATIDLRGLANDDSRAMKLIGYLDESADNWNMRTMVMDFLIPGTKPMRYPQRAVDDALLRLLARMRTDDQTNSLVPVYRALAARGRTECFDTIAQLLYRSDKSPDDIVLDSLLILATKDTVFCQPRLEKLLAEQLRATGLEVTDIIWPLWVLDARSFAPALADIATSGPRDYQSKIFSSSQIQPITGRYHLARQVAALWNEEDPLTRTKLLIAFGLGAEQDYEITDSSSTTPRAMRMRSELRRIPRVLDDAQLAELRHFVDWCASDRFPPARFPAYRARQLAFIKLVRACVWTVE